MGSWLPMRPTRPSLSPPSVSPPTSAELTPVEIWNRSKKEPRDLSDLIDSAQSVEENHMTAITFITTITNRNKLEQYLSHLEEHLLKFKREEDDELLGLVHKQYMSLWLVWGQLESATGAAFVHEVLLREESRIHPSEKLSAIWRQGALASAGETMGKAVKAHFPQLLTSASIRHLLQSIVDQGLFVEDEVAFVNFLASAINFLQAHKQQCLHYAEALSARLHLDESIIWLHRGGCQQLMQESICSSLLSAGQDIWMSAGYSHGLELLFEVIRECNYELSPENQMSYITNRIYSLLIYSYDEVGLSYREFKRKPMSQHLHLLLARNHTNVLLQINSIYESAKRMRGGQLAVPSLESEVCSYIFSESCHLKLCLSVLLLGQFKICLRDYQPQFWNRLLNVKMAAIVQNEVDILQLLRDSPMSYFSSPVSEQLFAQVLDACKALLELGINQKLTHIWPFYFHNPSTSLLILQERALSILKRYISSWLIAPRGKKIALGGSTQTALGGSTQTALGGSTQTALGGSTQIVLDTGKHESIFQAVEWLRRHVFGQILQSPQQLSQIIFQHMLYFYRYEEAAAVLNNESLMGKFGMNGESLEIIVIENVREQLEKENFTEVLADVSLQIKMLKHQSLQAQAIKATFRLIAYLHENGIQLPSHYKQKIDVRLLYWLLRDHTRCLEILNFDEIYEEVRTIQADEVAIEDEAFLMTNELLLFKSQLAATAFKLGKKKMGNELIEEISRFNPPWMTTELIRIFRESESSMDKRLYAIALKCCTKGTDLKFLMQLWSTQKKKLSHEIYQLGKYLETGREYLETGREYLVIDDQMVMDEQGFRNLVAESIFSDETLGLEPFQLFFILLGTEPARAFHLALRTQLDALKLDVFLREGLKHSILNPFEVATHFFRMLYFAKMNGKELLFEEYEGKVFTLTEILEQKELQTKPNKIVLEQLLCKAAASYLFSISLSPAFIETHLSHSPSKNPAVYQVLYSETNRKSMLVGLREEPMDRTDILKLGQICTTLLDVNLGELCLFSVVSKVNKSQQVEEAAEHMLQKIAVLTFEEGACSRTVEQFVARIFSVRMLAKVLDYLRGSQNATYEQIIGERHLKIIKCLANVEEGQQFHGLIPSNFFGLKLSYCPKWPISQEDQSTLRRCGKRQNILVLSKVLYFLYGMNSNVEKKALEIYICQHPEEGEFLANQA